LSLIINTNLGLLFYRGRDPDQALKQFRLTLEMDHGFFLAHRWLGLAYEQKGMYEEAIAEFQTGIAQSNRQPMMLAELGRIYGVKGRVDDAQKVLEELQELSGRRYVSPFMIALVFAGLGKKDQAFESLGKAYRDRGSMLHSIKVEPALDSLRSDARFTELLRRMNFPP
jgi:tetratricopeptide (TPR) repeat protein